MLPHKLCFLDLVPRAPNPDVTQSHIRNRHHPFGHFRHNGVYCPALPWSRLKLRDDDHQSRKGGLWSRFGIWSIWVHRL